MDRALEAALSAPVSEVKAELFKALGHPARIRVLELLSEGERSVGELQPLVGSRARTCPSSSASSAGGLVTTRKEGASVIYSLATRCWPSCCRWPSACSSRPWPTPRDCSPTCGPRSGVSAAARSIGPWRAASCRAVPTTPGCGARGAGTSSPA